MHNTNIKSRKEIEKAQYSDDFVGGYDTCKDFIGGILIESLNNVDHNTRSAMMTSLMVYSYRKGYSLGVETYNKYGYATVINRDYKTDPGARPRVEDIIDILDDQYNKGFIEGLRDQQRLRSLDNKEEEKDNETKR